MLPNDPLPGTLVRTNTGLREEKTERSIPQGRPGTVVKRVTGDGRTDDPDDIFEIQIDGRVLRIARKFLDPASR